MSNILNQAEYVEQAHFFQTYLRRLEDNISTQEILTTVREELLATTSLPYAVEFLMGEILLHGQFGKAMLNLPHYFTPFQAFIFGQTEERNSKFDQHIALRILQREAEYRAQDCPIAAALFIFQFECIARNHLGYGKALESIAADPFYNEDWSTWIYQIRHQLGTIDFADLVYIRSEYAAEKSEQNPVDSSSTFPVLLFGKQEGRIALANRGKDPLYLFAALQRHLGYPEVPHYTRQRKNDVSAELASRLQQVETRISLLESENKGNLDLSQFYTTPEEHSDEP